MAAGRVVALGRAVTLGALVGLVGACAGPDGAAVAPSTASGSPSTVSSLSAAGSLLPSPSATVSPMTGPLDRSVTVDGRSIRIMCRGERPAGAPVIWLEPGLGGGLLDWSAVVGPLANLTRVCAWDRPGAGASAAPPAGTRTVDDILNDLDAVLDGAGIVGPFIVAAHSLGPWVTTSFMARHPGEVVGLVFVDPRGPAVTARWRAIIGKPVPGEPQAVADMRSFLDGLEDNVEHLAIAPSEAIVEGILGADGPAYGDRPVVVLGAADTMDDWPPLTGATRDAVWKAWVDGQRRYAAESTAGSFVSVAGSSHFVMSDQPQAVVDAVAKVLAAIRR